MMEYLPSLLAFAGLGSILLLLSTRAVLLSLDTYSWPTTRAAIKTGEIDELRGYIRLRGKQLMYSYYVGDEMYTSNRIYAAIPDNLFTYGIHFYSADYIEESFENIDALEVHYDPSNPERCCIKQGGTKFVLQESAIFLVMLVAFCIVLLPEA